MALFPNIIFYDSTVQVNDRTRFSAEKSYVTNDESALTGVEINPDVGGSGSYISVTGSSSRDWTLDYQYAASGTYVVGVRISNAEAASSVTGSISVITEASDYLFSTDQDLIAEEPDIMSWLPDYRSSYNYLHRRAQERMFAWIDEQGWTDVYQDKFTKTDVADPEELNEWSKYMVLRMHFQSLSNAKDDKFEEKAAYYSSREKVAKNRLILRLDVNADGVVDDFEDLYMSTTNVIRR